VLQLVAEGRLSLADTVERWLPGILPYGNQVTIRQLLNHTSGIPDNALEPLVTLYTFPAGRSRAWTPRELVALIADRPPDFPPGTAWSYSNTGYVLAGMIVEAATSRTLGHELTRRILRPPGLREPSSRSTAQPSPDRIRVATACRSSMRLARCWTSRSTTPRWPEARAT
jgi:D-alanyl-D-alanine carboxypeptidase